MRGSVVTFALTGFLAVNDVHSRYIPRAVGAYNQSQPFNGSLTLGPGQEVYLDYGALTAGYPVLGVANASGAYIEVLLKYSQSWPALSRPTADGPYNFQNGLAGNFRTETVNITDVIRSNSSQFRSYFIQGAQRWQSVTLTQGSSLTLSYIGFDPTAATTARQDASGDSTLQDSNSTFSCDNDLFNRIWQMGPKSAQIACTRGPGSLPSVWEQAGSDGVLIRGQRPKRSANMTGNLPTDGYTFSFQTQIVRTGFGFVVDAAVTGYGPFFAITGNLPDETTFSTFNRSLLPAQTLTVGSGFGLLDQVTTPGLVVARYPLPTPIYNGQWINVSCTAVAQTTYNISINGQLVAAIANYSALPGSLGPSPFYLGSPSIGVGGWQDQDAYYRALRVTSLNDSVLYSNPFTDYDTFGEFAVLPNSYSQCFDAGVRDRLVWIGDFKITAETLAVSTMNYDAFRGTLQSVFDYIGNYGGVGISNPPGTNAKYASTYNNPITVLFDYQLDILNAVYTYWMSTGDTAFVSGLWSRVQRQTAFLLTWVVPSTNLWAPPAVFRGSVNGSSSSAYLVYTLRHMASIANAMNQSDLATNYTKQADATANALQTLLFNTTTGVFQNSLTNPNATYTDIAFTMLANISTANQTRSQLKALNQLKGNVGYGSVAQIGGESNISPFFSGFALEAFAQVNATEPILFLLNSLFGSMAKPGPYYTGAPWEYIDDSGEPGLGNFTSLGHPWGSAGTSLLTRYGLGIRPVGAGYSTWTMAPLDLGLNRANGTLNSLRGPIIASWSRETGKLSMNVSAPAGTTGSIVPFVAGTYSVNGGNATSVFPIVVQGGRQNSITQQ